MKRVTGIGGVFFKAKDPQALAKWYNVHLGMDVQDWNGTVFEWNTDHNPKGIGTTTWSVFKDDTSYFSPSSSPFMVNYRVDNLMALVTVLREEGCQVLDKIEESEYGIFAWVVDPEGNKVELWQPPAGR